jgi:hypothetical protein
MQDRYAGDIGDYAKLALLRAISPDLRLGVAWYLYPDENHNTDGRHIGYLDQPHIWRGLDPVLFDSLAATVKDQRKVAALESVEIAPGASFFREAIRAGNHPPSERSSARSRWFGRALEALSDCDLVFADPDNGLIDDADHRRRDRKFGKQMPLREALTFAQGRQAVIYHHNTRFPGGHDLEIRTWQERLGPGTMAIRANAFSCRTFFILNATDLTRERAITFANRWKKNKVSFVPPL